MSDTKPEIKEAQRTPGMVNVIYIYVSICIIYIDISISVSISTSSIYMSVSISLAIFYPHCRILKMKKLEWRKTFLTEKQR
jgi:hypothetical protein